MAISRRADYAVRLVAALMESEGEPLSVRAAAERQQVPYAFARSIQHDLVLSGIAASRRGAHGGIVLAADPSKLTVLDVIEAVQGELTLATCARDEDWCPRAHTCPFHYLWIGADEVLRDYLSNRTMRDVMDDFKQRGPAPRLKEVSRRRTEQAHARAAADADASQDDGDQAASA